jgi:hypothetical protein
MNQDDPALAWKAAMTKHRPIVRDILAFSTIPVSLVVMGLLATNMFSNVQAIENAEKYQLPKVRPSGDADKSSPPAATAESKPRIDPIEQKAEAADLKAIPGDDVTPSVEIFKVDAKQQMLQFSEKYDIVISSASSEFRVEAGSGQPADREEVEYYAKLFVQEISLYPPIFVRLSEVKQVVLCKELSSHGHPVGGFAQPGRNTIYLSIPSTNGWHKRYACSSFHHELFHMIDHRMGLLYEDPHWSSLNTSGFQYGTVDQASLSLTTNTTGFLNTYSMKSLAEDKAETSANLFVNAEYVASKMNEDIIFRTKVELMKERIANLCPQINDNCWAKVAKR